mmetsp:Transcript_52857/g.158215  ORF Transcript_52857/g.158215 Transcript_52857/m.158215 type:complete len:227 (-) Transcript_52857:236-916(-)
MALLLLHLLCSTTAFLGDAFSLVLVPSRHADIPYNRRGEEIVVSAPRSPLSYRCGPLGLFGLFGGDDSPGEDGDLATFSSLASTDQKFDSLSEYLREWGRLFEGDKPQMGLTTPVKVFPSSGPSSDDDAVVAASGVRIVFQPTQTGGAYKSKEEEQSVEDGEAKRKGEPKKEGGVEVLAERLSGGEVRVRATRCDIEEGTMIKEMSEEAIVQELKKAIDVWRKEQG